MMTTLHLRPGARHAVPSRELSDEQREGIDFVAAYQKCYGRGPCYREIAIAMGFGSSQRAARFALRLCDIGALVCAKCGPKLRFIVPHAPIGRSKPAPKPTEYLQSRHFHAAIVVLRRQGHKIEKRPHGHSVDGVLCSAAQVLRLAEMVTQ